MPMLASAWLIAARASPRLALSMRLNEIVVASSPSWWLTEVGAESSKKRATAVSGTRLVALLLRTLPVEAFFSAGLADTGTLVLPVIAAVCAVDSTLTAWPPLTTVFVAGT